MIKDTIRKINLALLTPEEAIDVTRMSLRQIKNMLHDEVRCVGMSFCTESECRLWAEGGFHTDVYRFIGCNSGISARPFVGLDDNRSLIFEKRDFSDEDRRQVTDEDNAMGLPINLLKGTKGGGVELSVLFIGELDDVKAKLMSRIQERIRTFSMIKARNSDFFKERMNGLAKLEVMPKKTKPGDSIAPKGFDIFGLNQRVAAVIKDVTFGSHFPL